MWSILIVVVLAFYTLLPSSTMGQQLYQVSESIVTFISYAELEIIKAESRKLVGLLDISTNKFAFKMRMNTFDGFNSQQQKVHFQEKFLETEKYPNALFEGKIIEPISLPVTDVKKGIRIKGKLTVHGKSVEKMMKIELYNIDGEMHFEAKFDIPLADHDIRIPKIVKYNIAEVINVDVKGKLLSKE